MWFRLDGAETSGRLGLLTIYLLKEGKNTIWEYGDADIGDHIVAYATEADAKKSWWYIEGKTQIVKFQEVSNEIPVSTRKRSVVNNPCDCGRGIENECDGSCEIPDDPAY